LLRLQSGYFLQWQHVSLRRLSRFFDLQRGDFRGVHPVPSRKHPGSVRYTFRMIFCVSNFRRILSKFFGCFCLFLFSASNATACNNCPDGQGAASGSVVCTDCAVGFYSNSSTQFACTLCPPGSVRSVQRLCRFQS